MNRWIWNVVKLLLSVGLIWMVLQNAWAEVESGGPELRSLLLNTNIALFAIAVLLNGLSFVGSAYQWHLLLKYQEVDLKWLRTLQNYFVGLFFNHFLLGNAGGDVQKVVDVHREKNQWKQALMATLFDRVFGLFVINCFALFIGWIYFLDDPQLSLLIWPSTWIFICIGIFFAILFSRRLSRSVIGIIHQVPKLSFVEEKLQVVVDRFALYRKDHLIVKLIAFSILIQFVRIYVHYLVGLSLGIELDLIYYLYFIPIIGIVSALPISIAGFGPREFLAQTLFVLVGVGSGESILIQLLALMSAFVPSLIGGWIFFRRKSIQKDVES